MGNDENWIRCLREAGRGYEVAPVQGLWDKLEGELLAANVARRSVWWHKLWYAAAILVVAALASIYIICDHSYQEESVSYLTITTGGLSEGDMAVLIEDDVETIPADNNHVGNWGAVASYSEPGAQSVTQRENEGYGEFSYYERVIVVENGPDSMNSDCVMVSAGTDMRAPDNAFVDKPAHGRGIGGRLYTSASGANLSGGMPVSVGAAVDIPVADRLSLETGLEFTGVRTGGAAECYMGVPVKVKYDVLECERMRVYASAGGAVDKSLGRRGVSVSVNAGVGLEYSVDDKWGVFVEPGVEYRPGNGGCVPTACSERHIGPEVRVGFRHTFR